MILIQSSATHPFKKILAGVLGLGLLAAAMMFSVILIPLLALAGAIGYGYFYWKTRALRKAMAEQRNHQENRIIEGEAIVIHESHEPQHRA